MQFNNDKILIELIQNQRKTVVNDKKLLYGDLKRVSKYLSNSIFTDKCSLWDGYITTIKNYEKSSYINFYFNRKKYALHRLLYQNYVGDLQDSEYIKFNCPNKGKCCTIGHFYKILKSEDTNDSDGANELDANELGANELGANELDANELSTTELSKDNDYYLNKKPLETIYENKSKNFKKSKNIVVDFNL